LGGRVLLIVWRERLYGVRLRFYKYRFTVERKRRCLENYLIR
jgi:hypothetical protein